MHSVNTVGMERLAEEIVRRVTIEIEASGRHVHLSRADVDALFGVGLSRPIQDPALTALIERINRSEALVVSADIASGVEADTGRILSLIHI